jgi:hypothetical protein
MNWSCHGRRKLPRDVPHSIHAGALARDCLVSDLTLPTILIVNRRHKSTVVVYDPRSKQVSLRHDQETECPTCHRPFGEAEILEDPQEQMNPSYFYMLDQSLNGPPAALPQEPRRRLPSYSGEALRAPPGTQFVASEPRTPPVTQGISPSAFSRNYFKTFFREERELGKGGKGVVLLVTHILDGCELGQFACKRVPVGNNHDWLEKVLLEVRTLQNLSHANLVSYRHVWLEDYQLSDFSPKVPFCFILQVYFTRFQSHLPLTLAAILQLW